MLKDWKTDPKATRFPSTSCSLKRRIRMLFARTRRHLSLMTTVHNVGSRSPRCKRLWSLPVVLFPRIDDSLEDDSVTYITFVMILSRAFSEKDKTDKLMARSQYTCVQCICHFLHRLCICAESVYISYFAWTCHHKPERRALSGYQWTQLNPQASKIVTVSGSKRGLSETILGNAIGTA